MKKYKRFKDYISKEVWDYVNEVLYKRYSKFSDKHGFKHIKDTIKAGCNIALMSEYPNIELVFIACAYHDIGREIEAANHNWHSAVIASKELKTMSICKHLSQDDIKVICTAIYEHPRTVTTEKSLLGKILSDADKYSNLKQNGLGMIERNWGVNKKKIVKKEIDKIHNILREDFKEKGEGKCKLHLNESVKLFDKSVRKLIKISNSKAKLKKVVKKLMKEKKLEVK